MSDEAHFHLNGTVNKQNCCYWSPDNVHTIHQQPLHSDHVTVWCAVAPFGIIGPYFFEKNRITVTVNSLTTSKWLQTFCSQNCAVEEQSVPMCGFNKMVPQRTLHTSQWPLFETCFPGTLFPVSETCHGPLALPTLQRVTFFFGGIWNRVFMLTNPVCWMIWRKPSVRKLVWSIVSCWPVSWTI